MGRESLRLIETRQKMLRTALSLAAQEVGGACKYVTYADMADAARELVAAQDAWDAEMKRRRRELAFMSGGTSMQGDGK